MVEPAAIEVPADVRAAWEDFSSDPAAKREMEELERARRTAAGEIVELLRRFLAGDVDAQELRSTFDRRTRSEWQTFGLKGLSGAMFLNQLVKHLSDHRELEVELASALDLPADEGQAEARMERFLAWLREVTEREGISAQQLSPGRAPFFLSALWHVRAPERWPAFFPDSRKALRSSGLFTAEGLGPAQRYLAFRRAYLALAEAIGASAWQLETLLHRLADRTGPEVPAPGPDDGDPSDGRRVWLIAPGVNAVDWDVHRGRGTIGIGWKELGDLSRFESRDAIRDVLEQGGTGENRSIQALCCWEFAKVMSPGDLVFAKKGRARIIGLGRVRSDYRYVADAPGGPNLRDVEWVRVGDWPLADQLLAMKTVTDITESRHLVGKLAKLVDFQDEEDPGEGGSPGDPPPKADTYTIEHALEDLFVERETLEGWVELLRARKNLVLQGPPGVGKTFVARRLAWLLMGERDRERLELVQFHPSYSYEDFVQGYRPRKEGGFELREGPFLTFATRAGQDLDSPHVLIVDEINRGNLSKILGELMLLIEHDKRSRDWAATLAYGGEEPFHVPPNLHIVGTMNTADRSLALVDYALRRRFAFVELEPGFATDAFERHLLQRGADPGVVRTVRSRMGELNRRIRKASGLGRGFEIGHSYFCGPAGASIGDGWWERLVQTEIAPLLREYWFDDEARVEEELRGLLDAD